MLTVVHDAESANENGSGAGRSLLDEIVRDGARQMLAAALQAEVAAYVDAHAGEVDDNGRRLVVRNGYHHERDILTAAGAVTVTAPRVNDKRIDAVTGERQRFSSAILPAWARKSPQMTEVLPLLYLHGLSTSDFGPALEQFLGSSAGLSATTITRLTSQWQDEAKTFGERDLSGTDYVYLWVDGIHLKVRLEQEKLCLLVMIGVRSDGRKELVALADGYRESTESWADLLRGCRRGMTAPVLAVGDGALGFWKAMREVFPATREQRCWFHKQANVLSCLPKSAHPAASAAIKEIYNAEDIDHAQVAIKAFEIDYGAKYPKAVAKIVDDADVLLEFYKYPAEHWIHLRTTNPIESTFATVRLRTKVTKGPGSRAAGIAMAYKLIDAAQARWRAVNAPHLVALVRAGAVFHKGKLLERPADITPPEPGETTETEVA
ncbi:IS256 family transposase [Mycolicibacter sp. MYC123]|jgi:putative transposase|uniref:Mutator family transposase n=2 Tax=Mycobacteriaceae TaxID=1762 RepID=A0ABU5YSU3_9MYCO|nr:MULTISPECIES: IS256 family transposase [Mycobacteriaceae]MBI2698470.1 IS256 family transposase [Mycobacterium sp.]MCA2245974.1 IS256 family transposase [Mycobacterium sp. WUMAC-067]MCA2317835.1 IS256 family transposase [Mycobacterium sp. WUMAC-025]MCQ4359952.1 IS256 family transposase [Mycobacterium gordonae]MEB3052494.1 IS256 family transposase [Mycolicibacter sp. MYC123]